MTATSTMNRKLSIPNLCISIIDQVMPPWQREGQLFRNEALASRFSPIVPRGVVATPCLHSISYRNSSRCSIVVQPLHDDGTVWIDRIQDESI